MNYFDRSHPAVSLCYFAFVILITMLTRDPVVALVGCLSGMALFGMLAGALELLRSIPYSALIAAVITLTNPIFSHRGATVLFFVNDTPITLESIAYGFFTSLSVVALIYWFRCYTRVITADKMIYLFGRISPRISLTVSMILGAIPRMKRKWRDIDDAQTSLGAYSSGRYGERIRGKMKTASILLTSSLEGAITTADSMKARGYGLKGRTCSIEYAFHTGDAFLLGYAVALGAALVLMIALGALDFDYYPEMRGTDGIWRQVAYCLSAALAAGGAIAEIKERIVWRYLRSRI